MYEMSTVRFRIKFQKTNWYIQKSTVITLINMSKSIQKSLKSRE